MCEPRDGDQRIENRGKRKKEKRIEWREIEKEEEKFCEDFFFILSFKIYSFPIPKHAGIINEIMITITKFLRNFNVTLKYYWLNSTNNNF